MPKRLNNRQLAARARWDKLPKADRQQHMKPAQTAAAERTRRAHEVLRTIERLTAEQQPITASLDTESR